MKIASERQERQLSKTTPKPEPNGAYFGPSNTNNDGQHCIVSEMQEHHLIHKKKKK